MRRLSPPVIDYLRISGPSTSREIADALSMTIPRVCEAIREANGEIEIVAHVHQRTRVNVYHVKLNPDQALVREQSLIGRYCLCQVRSYPSFRRAHWLNLGPSRFEDTIHSRQQR